MSKKTRPNDAVRASTFIPADAYLLTIKRAEREGFTTSNFIARCVEYVLALKRTPFQPQGRAPR